MYFRIATVIKDCCGELSEETIRTNFVFVNEIILEILVSSCKIHACHNILTINNNNDSYTEYTYN